MCDPVSHREHSPLKVAYWFFLQEFDVNPSRTVREEFYSVYQRQLAIVSEQERISKELETVGTDMNKMQVSCLHPGSRRHNT